LWSNPEYREKMTAILRENAGNHRWDGQRAGVNNPAYFEIPLAKLVASASIQKTIEATSNDLKVSIPKLQRDIKLAGYENWADFLTKNNIEKRIPNTFGKNNPNYVRLPWDNFVDTAREHKSLHKTAKALNVSVTKIRSTIRQAGFEKWSVFLEAYGINSVEVVDNEVVLNHKIVSIEPHGVIPVYDLTVPGYKNFATDTIFSHNTPEISAALDIYSEESTTPSEKGHILSIYSESKRVKSVLTNLFNNVLDININLQMWARNTCKYGDNFVYLKIDPERGIVGCYQLPNIELERLEGDAYRNAGANQIQKVEITDKDDLAARQVKFRWKDKNMDFQSWEIAHFRLLGDDRKLPYGTSMLDKCRRIWKQLLLAEDAMLIYRTSRAPERRVFKVMVGNMDDADVQAYVQRVANQFKRDQVADPRNGQVDTRYNQMAVDQDFFIPVRDPNTPNPIETLQGASNLGEIADIEYIQKKMLAALRIPKAFLGFEEVVGEGKGLSLMDIRFARTINRIQKSLIQELNKIAIIHLFLLGLEDELDNFTLGLTNPSTQSDLLKIEQWKEKILLYKDAVGDGQSIAPVSHTFAKKYFLGMSDEEVKLDLQQQKVERGIAEELNNSKDIKTGIFNKINSLYSTGENPQGGGEGGEDTGGGGSGGGSMGGLGGGGSVGDMGGIEPGEQSAEGGEIGETPPPDTGGATPPAPQAGGTEETPAEEETPEETPPLQESRLMNILMNKDEKNGFLMDLDKGKHKINEIDDQLKKLLGE
jgi:uncharacterized membrane protein YgcG